MKVPSHIAKIVELLKLPTRRKAKQMIKDGTVPEDLKRLYAMIAAGKIPTSIKAAQDDEEEEAA